MIYDNYIQPAEAEAGIQFDLAPMVVVDHNMLDTQQFRYSETEVNIQLELASMAVADENMLGIGTQQIGYAEAEANVQLVELALMAVHVQVSYSSDLIDHQHPPQLWVASNSNRIRSEWN